MDKVNTTQLLLSAVGALTTVVAVLFAQLRATDKRQQHELDDCKRECAADRRLFMQFLINLKTPEASKTLEGLKVE